MSPILRCETLWNCKGGASGCWKKDAATWIQDLVQHKGFLPGLGNIYFYETFGAKHVVSNTPVNISRAMHRPLKSQKQSVLLRILRSLAAIKRANSNSTICKLLFSILLHHNGRDQTSKPGSLFRWNTNIIHVRRYKMSTFFELHSK